MNVSANGSRQPSLGEKVIWRLTRLYRKWILRDRHDAALQAWFRDKGDLTRRLDYPLTTDSVVFDIGSYKGDFAEQISAKFGSRVFCFEPDPDFYAICRDRFSGSENVRCFDFGIGAQEGEFALTDQDNGSSIVRSDAARQGSKVVKIRDFAFASSLSDASEIDLLKVNIEGAEYDLLEAIISSGQIGQVKNLQVQFHGFVPDAHSRRAKIRSALAKTHREEWCYEFVWESWCRL